MDQFMEILKRNYTVADLFAHMEEFRGISYVFEHLADYTLPLTLHDWLTEGCPALAASLAQHPIREVMQITRDRVKVRQNRFQGTVNWGWDLTRADMAKLNYHSKMGFSFFAPAGTRSYPLHRHAQKNDNFMYILDGAKKFVIFNMTEGDKLYPTQLSGKTEFAEGDFYYEAEVISADLERHPLLKDAIGAMGVASKGDLIYIPCESIHVVQNEEDVLTVAWHMVVGDKCGAPPIDAQFREGSALKTETSHLKTEL